MSFWNDIFYNSGLSMAVPGMYGTFHIIAIGIILVLAVLAIGIFRNKSIKAMRAILITTSLILMLLEVYKIMFYCYNPIADSFTFDWSVFPWQFGIVSALIMFIAGISKEGKFQHGLLMFLATFSLFWGAAMLFYPMYSFGGNIVLNIQAMAEVGLLFIVGLYLWACGRAKFSFKRFGGAIIVFIIVAAVAVGLNTLMYETGWAGPYAFNMFNISQYHLSTIPYLGTVQSSVNPWVGVLVYAGVFICCAFIAVLVGRLIQKITKPGNIV